MGKKRIIAKGEAGSGEAPRGGGRAIRHKVDRGVLYVQATYNNTLAALTDTSGNALFASSSGALGFSGAKKGTPFAAAKVGEVIGERAKEAGVKEVAVVVRGVGSGRESVIRSFAAKGINILSIKDRTPVPFNGPRPPKPRRV